MSPQTNLDQNNRSYCLSHGIVTKQELAARDAERKEPAEQPNPDAALLDVMFAICGATRKERKP